jgi:hypothetical protein
VSFLTGIPTCPRPARECVAAFALGLAAIPGVLPGGTAAAGEWEFSGSVASELRVFPFSPAFQDQDADTISPSLSLEPRLLYEWNDGADRFTLAPFLRLDATESGRTHADLREANWQHIGDRWDLVVGIDKVFWGVAESRHLVDIVNQDDALEDIDGEDKLGQPMVNLNLLRDWGTVSLFLLPGFREREFPDRNARLRGPIPVATGGATFDSGAKTHHIDLAARWAHAIGDWDLGVAHFHGTSREPRLLPATGSGGETVQVPHYDQIDQTSLDLQFTSGAWLWKLEAMTRSGHGNRFVSAVAGFEHTLSGIFGTNADLGLLAEYNHDGRDEERAPATIFDDDMFLGTRLTFNDAQDTSALAGAIIDRDTQSTIFIVEAERRLGDSWRIELEGRFFVNVSRRDPLAGIRRDDFVTLRLSRFF